MKKWILVLSMSFAFNAYGEIVTGEKCGDNCTWTFNTETGKLTISGTGDMYNFPQWEGDTLVYRSYWHSDTPWVDFSSSIYEVEVESGITSIGQYSFWDTAVTKVSLPESLTTLGLGAFQYSDLPEVSLPSNLTTMNHAALHATSITDLVIPESVTSVSTYAFGSNALENITIEGNIELNKSMFYGEEDITERIPNLMRIYCLSSNESCNALKTDTDIGSKITSYTKETGVYKLEDGTMFASPNDMMSGTNACTDLDSCKATVLQNKGYCTGEACAAMVAAENTNHPIEYNNKSYASIDDLLKGKHMPKRIYTLDEANTVAGAVNRISIRYR